MAAYLADAFTIDGSAAELADTNAVVWIAEDAGCAAVGYATLHRGAIGNGVIANAPAEVQRIYVDQPWHGRRVGETLMKSCIAQSRAWHCDALWLAVWEENPRAIAFYQKMGFQVVGSTTFLLGSDRQNDLVMALPLA
jgi:GNAT superfamily N-acetyltransferase